MLRRSHRLTLLALGLLSSCSAAEPPITPTNAFFDAGALGLSPGSDDYFTCLVQGSYPFRGWPSGTRTDTAALTLQRAYFSANGQVVSRDTQYIDVQIRLTRLNGREMQILLGPPFGQSLIGTYNSQNLGSIGSPWLCSKELPFAMDSALTRAGYVADSVLPGYVTISRVLPPE